jgi:hypothetical protein
LKLATLLTKGASEMQIENRQRLNEKNVDEWRGILSEWQKSGETQKTFCSRLGIKYNTFVYWRGKLNGPTKEMKPEQFIPLKVKPESSEQPAEKILIIENKNGNKLFIPFSMAPEQLIDLLKSTGFIHA